VAVRTDRLAAEGAVARMDQPAAVVRTPRAAEAVPSAVPEPAEAVEVVRRDPPAEEAVARTDLVAAVPWAPGLP
jgi:hypothetical protein